MSRLGKDPDTLTVIVGALIVWLGAIGARVVFITPVIVSGFDLRVLVPSPAPAFWFLIGVAVTALPKEGDFLGESKSRVQRYAFIVLVGAALYYLIAVGSYVGPKNGLVETAQKYSTGSFTPQNGPLLLGNLAFLLAVASPVIMLLFPNLISRRAQNDRVIQGRSLISYYQAKKISEAKTKAEGAGLFFGMLNLPDRVAPTHFLVCGTTGAGKTTVLRLLQPLR